GASLHPVRGVLGRARGGVTHLRRGRRPWFPSLGWSRPEPVRTLGPHVRVDSGIVEGGTITSDFDPLLAKVITWGTDRPRALARMDAALASYTLLGCVTNTAYLRRLLRHPRVLRADLSTDLIASDPPEPAPDRLPLVYVAAALDHQLDLETGPDTDRFAVPDGWRMGAPAWTPWRLRAPGHEATVVRVRRNGEPGHYLVRWAE